jgi:outer membrane lipoprotein-sorting protein
VFVLSLRVQGEQREARLDFCDTLGVIMRVTMRLAIPIELVALLLPAALAQTQPDVAEILKKVAEIYKDASEYELVADATDAKSGTAEVYHMLFAFKAPNKYRMQGVGFIDADIGDEVVMVHDGSAVWFYSPKSNQYDSVPATALIDAPGDLGDASPEVMDGFMMGRYRGAADHTDAAKFLREETIEAAGAKLACYVVTVFSSGSRSAYTWWVDKARYRIVREDHDGTSAVYTTLKLNEPLPDELFTFKPPPGARKIPQQ